MNRNRLIVSALTLLVTTLAATAVRAQEFPGLGVGDIAAANARFDAQFDQWAHVAAWQVALATPNDQPLGIDAMSISRSISAGNDAALGYVRASEYNSNRAIAAVERWDTGAIQNNWYYNNGNGGPTYVMPYSYNNYNVQNGYIYGGYQPGGQNLYQMYGR